MECLDGFDYKNESSRDLFIYLIFLLLRAKETPLSPITKYVHRFDIHRWNAIQNFLLSFPLPFCFRFAHTLYYRFEVTVDPRPRRACKYRGGLWSANTNFNRHAQVAGMKIRIRESALAARVCRPLPTGICLSNKRLSTGNWDNSCEWKLNDSFRRRKSELVNPRLSSATFTRSRTRGWKIVSRESPWGGNASDFSRGFHALVAVLSLLQTHPMLSNWEKIAWKFSFVESLLFGENEKGTAWKFVLIQNYRWRFREWNLVIVYGAKSFRIFIETMERCWKVNSW